MIRRRTPELRDVLGVSVVGLVAAVAIWAGLHPSDGEQTHPTAAELAADRDVLVGEWPAEADGLDGPHGFCTAIGGKVLATVTEKDAIRCEVNGQTVDIPVGDDNPDNDAPMDEACGAAQEAVEFVAAAAGEDFTVPACIVDKP